ncbi:hypothetical protein BDV25DRAFT_135725 [Aspergillus avenaceus]|uniref:Mid2 domain-containing protein n=1 Tax=Aspergillus avenaceus TaxID=36643 RepID=A0A5N6U7D8_ASPAV|nr:hypothetical protein BDV25DRAFT_135725 [Aspergillus avenaceus]
MSTKRANITKVQDGNASILPTQEAYHLNSAHQPTSHNNTKMSTSTMKQGKSGSPPLSSRKGAKNASMDLTSPAPKSSITEPPQTSNDSSTTTSPQSSTHSSADPPTPLTASAESTNTDLPSPSTDSPREPPTNQPPTDTPSPPASTFTTMSSPTLILTTEPTPFTIKPLQTTIPPFSLSTTLKPTTSRAPEPPAAVFASDEMSAHAKAGIGVGVGFGCTFVLALVAAVWYYHRRTGRFEDVSPQSYLPGSTVKPSKTYVFRSQPILTGENSEERFELQS